MIESAYNAAPILKYPGAKWRLAPWILSHMPPHGSYVEPYFGSGAVFFLKTPARIETINDVDSEVVTFFRVCRDQPDELAEALRLTPWARDERDAAYSEPAGDELEQARRFAVKCCQTFGASRNKTQGWRNSTGKGNNGGPDNPKLWARLPQSVTEASRRLLEAQIENRPALEVIERYNGVGVLIYADPPYMKETRSMHGDAFVHEMTDADHEELIKALLRHAGPVMLSGYDSPFYNDRLRGWRKETVAAQANCGARRTECLWINPAGAGKGQLYM